VTDAEANADHAQDELLAFTCPRCGVEVTARFYGPCRSCRAELLERFERDGRDIEVGVYEPKMNVTPNAVAMRDDD
jgi:hypothetical protein